MEGVNEVEPVNWTRSDCPLVLTGMRIIHFNEEGEGPNVEINKQ